MRNVYKVDYEQRFKGAKIFFPYTNTIVTSGDALSAANRMRDIAYSQELDGKACIAVKITAVNLVSKIDY